MKKLCTLFCLAMVILSAINPPALATEPNEKVIDLGDGYYVVETITQLPMGSSRSRDTVNGQKTDTLYYGSTVIGTATLYATFDISGSTAEVLNASITGSGRNGGTYVRGTVDPYNNTVSGTAYFKYNGNQLSLIFSLSCTPDGTLY